MITKRQLCAACLLWHHICCMDWSPLTTWRHPGSNYVIYNHITWRGMIGRDRIWADMIWLPYHTHNTCTTHTQQQWQQASMNDSLTLLDHFFVIFHARNSLYDWFRCSTQTVVGELTEVGQRLVVAVGGLGGKGNAALRTKGAWYRVAVLPCCTATALHCTALRWVWVWEIGCDI